MKEVKAQRYAGPYDDIPFENYIQSPIGLLLKAGNKTRFIFHLSYESSKDELGRSLNGCTPKEKCTVKYNNLDTAVKQCILESEHVELVNVDRSKLVFLGKTDLLSAFCVLPMQVGCFQWLVLMAEDPKDQKIKYFVDKCLPFGVSISCSHYQRFLNALRHIMEFHTQRKAITNYPDDFLFIAFAMK